MIPKISGKKKVSIDFTPSAYELLVNYAKKTEKSNSAIINLLVETFLSLTDLERKYLSEFCNELLEKENNLSSKTNDSFEVQEKENKSIRLSNLIDFLTEGRGIINPIGNSMVKITIKNGDYVIVPFDWIVLDYKHPEECSYVGVVSMRNSEAYNAPTFLFFSDIPINMLTAENQEAILEHCQKKQPSFSKIIAMQVTPVYDENNVLLNGDLWAMAPTIGYFPIGEYGKDSFFPANAMIVRNKN